MPLLPAGLGPRDAAARRRARRGVIGAGPATALAIALRVVSFAGELVAIAVAELAALVLAPRAPRAVAARRPDPGTRLPARATASRARSSSSRPTTSATRCRCFVERFAATGLDLLVVDDSSPDGTGELADALAAERPWMHVLHRAGKDGLGMAYRAGFALVPGARLRASSARWTATSPTRRRSSPRCARVLDEREAGLVLGSRYMPGGGTDGWTRPACVLSRIGCTGSRLVLGLPFADLSGGFKLWRASTLAAIDIDELLSAGYAFQVETTQLAHLDGQRIEEVPFVFSERIAGASKMTLAVSLEGIRVTLALRRRARGRGGGLLVDLTAGRRVAPWASRAATGDRREAGGDDRERVRGRAGGGEAQVGGAEGGDRDGPRDRRRGRRDAADVVGVAVRDRVGQVDDQRAELRARIPVRPLRADDEQCLGVPAGEQARAQRRVGAGKEQAAGGRGERPKRAGSRRTI